VGVTYTLADGSGAVGGASCGAGIDYVNPGPQTLSFGDTVTSQPINVTLCTDAVTDPAETFTIMLSAPTGGASLGSPTLATATITDVPPPLAGGSYNLPGDFASLTNAGGIFERLNLSGATGNITINIVADLTGELGTNGLNSLAGGFTVLIKPTGAPRSIIGSTASNALIRINGASGVTIDGSTAGGTDRSLSITNASVTTPQVVRFGSIGTTPINNDTLKNCIIRNGVNTSSAIVASDTTGTATAGYSTNLAITNNDIGKAFVGIYVFQATAAGNGAGLVIAQNKMDNTGANAIRNVGIYVQGADGVTATGININQNAVGNFEAASDENDTGIWLAPNTKNASVSGNTVTNIAYTGANSFAPVGIYLGTGIAAMNVNVTLNTVAGITTSGSTGVYGILLAGGGGVTVQRNNVTNVNNTNSSTYGAFGIVMGGDNDVVQNNFVSNITHTMTGGAAFDTSFGVFGILLASGNNAKVYHNSVNLTGTMAGTATTNLLTAAFGITVNTQTGIDVRNNIFADTMNGGTTSIAHVAVFLPAGGTSAMNLTMNNNAYYYGTDATRQGTGQAGTTAGTNFYTTLAALKAYTSTLHAAATNDNASIAATTAVPYLSTTDLHIPASATAVIGTGAAIGAVTNDFDNDPRPASNPDIGADEIVQASGGVVPSGTFYNASFGSGGPDTLAGNVTITNSLTLTGMVDTGANTLTIDCGAVVISAGGGNYIIGNVKKNFCGAGTFTFPVGTFPNGSARPGSPEGTVAEYTPMTATINSGTFPSSLTVKVNDTWMPGTSTLNSLSRHWDVTETGDLNADMTFNYLNEDVYGNENGYLVVKFESGTASSPPGSSVNPAANTFTAVNISQFSKWGAGLIPTAAGAAIGGRVLDANGHGIANAQVVISGGDLAQPMMIQTGPFGYYNFTGLAVSRLYVVSVRSGRHTFAEPTRAIDLSSDVTNADFVADPAP
jgi:hypothetical protein